MKALRMRWWKVERLPIPPVVRRWKRAILREDDDDDGVMLQLQQGLNVVADGSIKDEIIVMQMNDTLVSLFPPTLMLLQLVS